MIPIELLESYGAQIKTYQKDDIVFKEAQPAKYFYQIETGKVKMYNLTEEGKEFIQGLFEVDTSFGEPPLFGDFKYPASALCLTDCRLIILNKRDFFKLLEAHPNYLLKFTKQLCKRMLYKAKIMKEVSVYPPEHRILTLLHHLKDSAAEKSPYIVPLTRQQISELTGLRVETVIRSIKKLEKSEQLSLVNHKIYL